MKNLKYILFSILIICLFASCRKNDTPSDSGDSSESSSSSSYTPSSEKPDVEKPTSLSSLSDLEAVALYSVNNTYLVEIVGTINDSNTTVYKVERTISISDLNTKKGSSLTYTYSLDQTFTLSKETSVYTFDSLDVNTLFNVEFVESYFTSKTITLSGLVGEISKENAKLYFKDDSFKTDTNVSVNIAVSDFKLQTVTYSYTLDNKTITSTTTYNYLS